MPIQWWALVNIAMNLQVPKDYLDTINNQRTQSD
jgi:hypothetical protein